MQLAHTSLRPMLDAPAAHVECTCFAAAVSGALSSSGGLAHLTAGYSLVTWLVVANLGFTGLLVSWVMKFADSIMKVQDRCCTSGMICEPGG